MGDPMRPYGVVILALGAALCAAASGAHGQVLPGADSVRIVGQVVDQTTGVALSEARVSIVLRAVPAGETPGSEARTVWADVTDSTGTFATMPIPAGNYGITVEALGYRTADEDVELSGSRAFDISVELVPQPLELEPLVVVTRRQSRLETSGFYDRRRMGTGYSLTRDEIEAHRPLRASDVFRWVPGVTLVPSRRGAMLRFRGCSPDVILDGTPLVGPVPLDEILSADDVEAVEVFSGAQAPVSVPTSSCGAVMIWTREGGRDEKGHPLTWRRLLAAGAFVTLAILLTR